MSYMSASGEEVEKEGVEEEEGAGEKIMVFGQKETMQEKKATVQEIATVNLTKAGNSQEMSIFSGTDKVAKIYIQDLVHGWRNLRPQDTCRTKDLR